MGVGRFACVALPLGLTIASLVCILVAGLAGVTDKSLFLFEVNTTDLSISPSALESLVAKRELDIRAGTWHDYDKLAISTTNKESTTDAINSAISSATSGNNVTASSLGLADVYKVSLWSFCATTGKNTTCTKAKFNWAASTLNITNLTEIASSTGVTVKIPTDITNALKTFTTVSKWTQIVYFIAFIALGLEVVVGIFAICSRAGSCCTFMVNGLCTSTTIAASILATVTSVIVTAALQTTAKPYGVTGKVGTTFLAITWLGVAFNLAAGVLWIFTICCCAAEHRHSNRRSYDDREKLVPANAYQRVEPYPAAGYSNQPVYHMGPTGQRAAGGTAYEPYSHSA